MYTVRPSEQTCEVMEALSSKRPCQEDGNQHQDSNPDDETDSSKNNPRGSQALRTVLTAILCRAGLEICK